MARVWTGFKHVFSLMLCRVDACMTHAVAYAQSDYPCCMLQTQRKQH
jgi:hypothetical protein